MGGTSGARRLLPLAPLAAALALLGAPAMSCRRGVPEADDAAAAVVFPPGPDVEVLVAEGASLVLLTPAPVAVLAAGRPEVLFEGLLPPSVPVRLDGGAVCLDGLREAGGFEVRLIPVPAGGDTLAAGGTPAGREASNGGETAARPRHLLALERADGKRRYRGALRFLPAAGAVRAINRLSLEEYTAGVVAAEMPLSYPLEALKAQAVAARGYALYELLWQQDHGGFRPFPATPAFQAYRGVGTRDAAAARAVLETAGQVLFHRGALFRPYYHSTCGGGTLAAATVFGDAGIPPLAGTACVACAGSRLARWEDRRERREIEAALRGWAAARGMPLGAVEDLGVAEATADGRPVYLHIRHALGELDLRADRFRSLLAESSGRALRSSAFEVQSERDAFLFRGRGFGHRVGLCQTGAGRLGAVESCEQILARYYPESEIGDLGWSE